MCSGQNLQIIILLSFIAVGGSLLASLSIANQKSEDDKISRVRINNIINVII